MIIKERPILFSAPMVRAILAGRKTMTRRVVKLNLSGRVYMKGSQWHPDDPNAVRACPYGVVGDRLWVRENFSGKNAIHLNGIPPRNWSTDTHISYSADNDDIIGSWTKTKPSIFMPRWASRITMEITGTRIERLRDIKYMDAVSEGLKRISKDGVNYKYGIPDLDGLPGNDDFGWHWKEWTANPGVAFKKLWDSINGKTPGKSWDDNPFVWVVEFKRIGGEK